MMPLDNLLCSLLENGVNKFQQLDKSTAQQRNELAGIVISVTLKELKKTLYFIISNQQIDILTQYTGQPNCFIRLNISALKELHNNHQLTYLIKTEQLEVDGDIQIAQKFAQLLNTSKIDWEEILSTKIGDILAHKLCYHSQMARKELSIQLKKAEQHSAKFITEELKLAPCALQVAHFCEQVDTLKCQCEKLEARIQQRFQQIG